MLRNVATTTKFQENTDFNVHVLRNIREIQQNRDFHDSDKHPLLAMEVKTVIYHNENNK